MYMNIAINTFNIGIVKCSQLGPPQDVPSTFCIVTYLSVSTTMSHKIQYGPKIQINA